jgi:peptidoglycan/LPS O-acetylase OafA/YrhL
VKFRYLDGLRGIAALVVVFDHLTFMFLPFAVNGSGSSNGLGRLIHSLPPLYLLISGDFAVTIFFVLSGIVLSAKFFRTHDEKVVAAGAVKRYFRLAIPTLGSVMTAYLLLKLGWMHNQQAGAISSEWWRAFWHFQPSLKDALYQGTYGAFFTDIDTYNPVLWTMQLEFLGSFIVFTTLLLFGRLRNRWIAYALLALFFSGTYYIGFVFGLAISDYLFNSRLEVQRWLAKGAWIPLLVVSLFLGSYPVTSNQGTVFQGLPIGWQFVALVHSLAALGTICAVLASPLLQRGLQLRPVLFLGRVSYPLYLLHFLVLGSYTSYFFVVLAGQFGHKWATLLVLPPTFAILFIVSDIYSRYVDVPAIQLSGRIYQRLFRVRPAAPAREHDPKAGVVLTS